MSEQGEKVFLRVMTETGEKAGEKLSFGQVLWVAMGGQM